MRSCVSHIVTEDSKYLKLLTRGIYFQYKPQKFVQGYIKGPEPLNKIH